MHGGPEGMISTEKEDDRCLRWRLEPRVGIVDGPPNSYTIQQYTERHIDNGLRDGERRGDAARPVA